MNCILSFSRFGLVSSSVDFILFVDTELELWGKELERRFNQ